MFSGALLSQLATACVPQTRRAPSLHRAVSSSRASAPVAVHRRFSSVVITVTACRHCRCRRVRSPPPPCQRIMCEGMEAAPLPALPPPPVSSPSPAPPAPLPPLPRFRFSPPPSAPPGELICSRLQYSLSVRTAVATRRGHRISAIATDARAGSLIRAAIAQRPVYRGVACLRRQSCAWVLVSLLACGRVCVAAVCRGPLQVAPRLCWVRWSFGPRDLSLGMFSHGCFACAVRLVLSCVPPCVGVQGRAAISSRVINVMCAERVREQCPKGMLTTLRIQILREDASRGAHNPLKHNLYPRSALIQACCGSTD